MNDRFEEMRRLLDQSKFFKLVCGAGNENAEEVRRLTVVYTLAGANGLDISATPSVVEACVSGIGKAYDLADGLGVTIETRPFITVSVGMSGDHHVRKATITDDCVECNLCIPACPTDAISDDFVVTRELCIGCGDCEAVCPPKVAAIEYQHDHKSLRKILPECLEAGAENIELHAAVPDDDAISEEWRIVNEALPDHFVSMCLDRLHLSNYQLVSRIRQAGEIAGERMIIQADGIPMSGGSDDFNTTLQAIAIADVICKDLEKKDRKFNKLPILLSGGTNSYTGKLAKQCNVSFSGVSIGTHARSIVKEYVQADDFDANTENLLSAVSAARDLIKRNLSL